MIMGQLDCLLTWKMLAPFHLFAAVVLFCFAFFFSLFLIYFALPIQMENQHINMINNKISGRWPEANKRVKPHNSLTYKSCHWLIVSYYWSTERTGAVLPNGGAACTQCLGYTQSSVFLTHNDCRVENGPTHYSVVVVVVVK